MTAFILVIIAFAAGLFLGKIQGNKKHEIPVSTKERTSASPVKSKPYVPPRKFRDSRWEERDELFRGMVNEGVILEGKERLTTLSEKAYFDNLKKWFGHYCYIHCQVSLGRMINFPEQPAFSEEERKRFFAIYNGMAMDYVLVSHKTNKIVCVIELDDPSHERADRILRDKWLNQIMSIAKIPFLRASVKALDKEPLIWETRDEVKSVPSRNESLH